MGSFSTFHIKLFMLSLAMSSVQGRSDLNLQEIFDLENSNVPEETECFPSWTRAGNNCYKISSLTMNWFKAQEYCYFQGSRLAEIRSESDQDLINDLLMSRERYWIGLTDLANEGVYVWQSDFQAATYTNWKVGEPNNYQIGGENCVHPKDHQWNDIMCTSAYYALCERSMP